MKKIIIILLLATLLGCEKPQQEKVEILSVTKTNVLVVNYEVKEAVELAIYEDGFIPMFKLTEKGRYAIITNANSLTFDWREGKIKVK